MPTARYLLVRESPAAPPAGLLVWTTGASRNQMLGVFPPLTGIPAEPNPRAGIQPRAISASYSP
jgi:hypothetical protein